MYSPTVETPFNMLLCLTGLVVTAPPESSNQVLMAQLLAVQTMSRYILAYQLQISRSNEEKAQWCHTFNKVNMPQNDRRCQRAIKTFFIHFNIYS